MKIIASLVGSGVTLLGLSWAYRHYFGWKPKIAITSRRHHRGSGGTDGFDSIGIVVEVWNRQKYNIVVKQVRLEIRHVSLLTPHHEEAFTVLDLDPDANDWEMDDDDSLRTAPDRTLGGGERASFGVATFLEVGLGSSSVGDLDIRAMAAYEDQRSGDLVVLRDSSWVRDRFMRRAFRRMGN